MHNVSHHFQLRQSSHASTIYQARVLIATTSARRRVRTETNDSEVRFGWHIASIWCTGFPRFIRKKAGTKWFPQSAPLSYSKDKPRYPIKGEVRIGQTWSGGPPPYQATMNCVSDSKDPPRCLAVTVTSCVRFIINLKLF
jgi:hypothetical protein